MYTTLRIIYSVSCNKYLEAQYGGNMQYHAINTLKRNKRNIEGAPPPSEEARPAFIRPAGKILAGMFATAIAITDVTIVRHCNHNSRRVG